RLSAADWSQPRRLPEDEACGLTATMRFAAATEPLQMHGVAHLSTLERVCGVTRLVRPFRDPESLAAEGEHLRHERHAVELPLVVEGTEDLLPAPDFHPVPGM